MEMLARITFWQGLITFLFLVVCLMLILVVLIQKGRGGGLSGAFGGAGGHSAFGAKTGDVFTWITVGLTGMFILMAVIGNYVMVPPPVTGAAQTPDATSLNEEADTSEPGGAATPPAGAPPAPATPAPPAESPAEAPGGENEN
jgi:preprotein translocase subunit SecG